MELILIFLLLSTGVLLFSKKIFLMIEEHHPAFLTARFLTVFRFITMIASVFLTAYMFSVYGDDFVSRYNLPESYKSVISTLIVVFGTFIAVALEMSLIASEKTIGFIDRKEKAFIYLITYLFLISINVFTMLAGLNKTADKLTNLELKSIENNEVVSVSKQKIELLKENKTFILQSIETLRKEINDIKNKSVESTKINRYKREIAYLKANMEAELYKYSPASKYPTKRAEIRRKYKEKIAYWEGLIDKEKSAQERKKSERILEIEKRIEQKQKELERINEKLSRAIEEKTSKKEKIREEIINQKRKKFLRNWKIAFFIQFFNLVSGVLSALLVRFSDGKSMPSSQLKARSDGKTRDFKDDGDDETTVFNLVYEIAKEESKKEGVYALHEGKQYLKHITREKLKSALIQRGIKWSGNFNEFYSRYSKNKKELFIQKQNIRLFKDEINDNVPFFAGGVKIN